MNSGWSKQDMYELCIKQKITKIRTNDPLQMAVDRWQYCLFKTDGTIGPGCIESIYCKNEENDMSNQYTCKSASIQNKKSPSRYIVSKIQPN